MRKTFCRIVRNVKCNMAKQTKNRCQNCNLPDDMLNMEKHTAKIFEKEVCYNDIAKKMRINRLPAVAASAPIS